MLVLLARNEDDDNDDNDGDNDDDSNNKSKQGEKTFSTYFLPCTPEGTLHVLTNVTSKWQHNMDAVIFIFILEMRKQRHQ